MILPRWRNLISNPGFENGQMGWRIAPGGGLVTGEEQYSGRYSLHIKHSTATKKVENIRFNTCYYFGFRYKLTHGGLRLYVNDGSEYEITVGTDLNQLGEWDHVEGDYKIPYDHPVGNEWREVLFRDCTGINSRGWISIHFYTHPAAGELYGDGYFDDFWFSQSIYPKIQLYWKIDALKARLIGR